jgi:hypothetical protein
MANVNKALPVLTAKTTLRASTYDGAIAEPSRIFQTRLIFSGLTLDNAYVKSIGYNSDVVTGSAFEIGTAMADHLDLVLIDMDGYITGYDFTDKEFTWELAIGDSVSWSYTQIGVFMVEEALRKNGLITMKATDRMYKANIPTVNTLVYPQTLGAILQHACTHCGITLATTTFPNSTIEVATEPSFYQVTDRKIIESCAELAGGYAKMDAVGQLRILTLSATDPKSIGMANFTTCIKDEVAQTLINKVIVQVGDYSEFQGSGASPYTILNNMFVQTPSLWLDGLYTVLNGLAFAPVSINWQGDYVIRAGKYLEVTNNGETFYSYALKRVLTYNGGLWEITDCVGKSEVVKDSKTNGSLTVRVAQSEAKISVLEDQIEFKVSQDDFDELGGEVSRAQADILILADEITTKVSSEDVSLMLENYSTLTQTDSKVSIAIGTVQVQIDAQGETITDVNTYFDFTTNLTIGKSGDPFKVVIDNDSFEIMNGDVPVSYINGTTMYAENLTALKKTKVGVHEIFRYGTTDFTLVTWVGE